MRAVQGERPRQSQSRASSSELRIAVSSLNPADVGD
jgi:hypothetical protein